MQGEGAWEGAGVQVSGSGWLAGGGAVLSPCSLIQFKVLSKRSYKFVEGGERLAEVLWHAQRGGIRSFTIALGEAPASPLPPPCPTPMPYPPPQHPLYPPETLYLLPLLQKDSRSNVGEDSVPPAPPEGTGRVQVKDDAGNTAKKEGTPPHPSYLSPTPPLSSSSLSPPNTHSEEIGTYI